MEKFDFQSRHMIEALRSGVPSRTIGAYFASSRADLLDSITGDLQEVAESGKSEGRIFTGRYGEGKTHLLNTVFSIAAKNNMAVSVISLSKETPASNLLSLYRKLMENTYLPGRVQPGFMHDLPKYFSLRSESTAQLLDFAKGLSTNRLYYVFKALLASENGNIDDYLMMRSDIEGNIASNTSVRKIYSQHFDDKVVFNGTFSKYRNAYDYFCFASRLFRLMGCAGWVILIDEAELIGRLPRKSRKKAYLNLSKLLEGEGALDSAYTLMAFSTSYNDDVITDRDEHNNIQLGDDPQEEKDRMLKVVDAIINAEELAPLSEEELKNSITGIITLHSAAYGWDPQVNADELYNLIVKSGLLLRTKIRSTIEYLDQLYLYGNAEVSKVGSVSSGDLSEVESLAALFE